MSFYWICMGDPAVQPVLQPLVSHALVFILFIYLLLNRTQGTTVTEQ